jgi:cullin 1
MISIPLQVGMNGMEAYERDFEDPMLVETASFYRRKAAEWITEDSCPDYMLKVIALWLRGTNRDSCHPSSVVATSSPILCQL